MFKGNKGAPSKPIGNLTDITSQACWFFKSLNGFSGSNTSISFGLT